MTRSGLASIAILAAILAGCANAGVERVTVSGRAVAGPTCAVESASPDPSCADRPVPDAVVVIHDEEGNEVGRMTTEQDGRFSVDLHPGSYVFVPQPVEGLMGTAPPVEVNIEAGPEPSEVVVAYDTGIR